MSDAMNDAAFGEKSATLYQTYHQAIRTYLADSNEENRQAGITAATRIDENRRGIFLGRSGLADRVSNLLEKLKNGDKHAWAKFLCSLRDDRHEVAAMLPLSPFKDRTFVTVDYGCGFVTLYGDIQPFLDSVIKGQNMRIYDADTYVVTLSKMNASDAEVIWVECGCSGPDIPTDRPRPA